MRILLLFLFFVVSLFANDSEKISLQLKWKYQFQFAGFIAAYEKGFYKDVGFDVNLIEFDASKNIIDDIKKRKIDFGVSDSSLVLARMRGEPVVAMMTIFQQSPFILLALKSANIKSIKDISSKKIALDEKHYGVAIKAMLKSNQIKYHIQPVTHTIDDIIDKKFDMMSAYLSNEPFIAKEKGLETVIFDPKDYGFAGYGDILFCSKEMIEKNPKMVQKFYKASLKGWEYAFSHIDEMVDLIYSKYNNLNKSKKALRYEAEVLKKLSGYGNNFGEINKEKIKAISQMFNFMIEGKYNFDYLNGFIYNPNIESKIELTDKEKKFIKTHPKIVLGSDKSWEPFVVVNKDGTVTGYDQEVLNLINQLTGANFQIKAGIWSKVLIEAKNKTIDGLSSGTAHKSREEYLSFSLPYITVQSMFFTSISANKKSIKSINDIDGRVIGIQKGNALEKQIVKQFKNAKIIEYDRYDDIVKAVATEKIDVMIGDPSIFYIVNRLKIPYIRPIAPLDKKMVLLFSVRKDFPEAISIINKALNHIGEQKLNQLRKKWFLETLVDTQPINFTKEELSYLKKKKAIKVHVEKDWAPFNFMENGEVKGFVNDYMKLLGDKLGVDVEFVQGYTWAKYMSMLKNSEIDIISAVTVTPKRVESYLFSNSSILDILISIVTKKGAENLTLEQLNGKKLAVVRGYASSEILRKYYPKIKLIKVDTNFGILQSVINGEADVGLGNYAVLDYLINKNFISGLVNTPIVGNRYFKSTPQHIALNKNEMVLKQIIDKGISSISNKKLVSLRDRWINTKDTNILNFTTEELAYLRDKNEIRVCAYNNHPSTIKYKIKNAEDILVEKKILNPYIKITTYQKEESYILEISDNGGGVPEDIKEKIFDPYFSTKTKKDGTGLGLYMSKIIIEEHCGGKLTVFNNIDGALFRIELKKGELR